MTANKRQKTACKVGRANVTESKAERPAWALAVKAPVGGLKGGSSKERSSQGSLGRSGLKM